MVHFQTVFQKKPLSVRQSVGPQLVSALTVLLGRSLSAWEPQFPHLYVRELSPPNPDCVKPLKYAENFLVSPAPRFPVGLMD